MRGNGARERRRALTVTLAGALAALSTAAVTAFAPAPAQAEKTDIPGTMSTSTQGTSSFAVHVPAGVEVKAVDTVVTEPQVVEGGTITFRVNGAVRKSVPSALYQKVRIPVTQADVIADGTIALTLSTEGPLAASATCVPSGGVASVRNIDLDYRGTETAPTTVADFFPASSSGVTVVIPADADSEMIEAGLTAVAALAYRYDDDTPVNLSLNVPAPDTATAGQRVVALAAGKAGDVTTAVSTTSGIPMLTLTGAGDALVNAARALSTDLIGLSGAQPQDLSQTAKPRNTARTRTLQELGVAPLTLIGYGSVSQQFELRQDSFGEPVSSMDVHLKGTHTAFPEASGARLDVRANGDLVGSTVLGQESNFDLDVPIPSNKLRSVNDITMTMTAVAPDGSACTPPTIPAAEADLDAGGSSVTVKHGTGQTEGFQLYPQIFQGTLPIALSSGAGRQASAAVNAAALVVALQRAAGSPLQIALEPPTNFLADSRSGLMVGALSSDSKSLDAPLKLSAKRLVDRDDSIVDFTSQDPYAVLESIDRNNRLVLMRGSWAPGDKAAPGELARKVVDQVTNSGWKNLDGDLVIADAANPAFTAASHSLAPHEVVTEKKSYVKWFVLAIIAVLLVLALQVVVRFRSDRGLARERDDEFDDVPAFIEDDDTPEDDEDADDDLYELDADDLYELDDEGDFAAPDERPTDGLGDVDGLGVHDYAAVDEPVDVADDEPVAVAGTAGQDDDTGEIPVVAAEEYDEDDDLEDDDLEDEDGDDFDGEDDDEADWGDWGEWGDESEEISPSESVAEDEESEPEDEPEDDDEPPTPPRRRSSD